MTESLGARRTAHGVSFSVVSSTAERVELCLFDTSAAAYERERIALRRRGDVWSAEVRAIGAGTVYGYRAHGAYAPAQGLCHNPNKLLLDPYARGVTGPLCWHPAQQGGRVDVAERDERDSAPVAPRGVVIDESFDWHGDVRPRTPWTESVFYECHVKGMTARHPELPPALRGSYLGLCAEPLVEYLKALGVTALCLMPVHESYSDRHLTTRGRTNYWGYNTLCFFAPSARYAAAPGRELQELKTLVRTLHAHGLEVLLDVVYNHSAESDHLGPTLSLRGLDNARYYRLRKGDPSRYENPTGTGNTLDLGQRRCRQLVLDSLRYWAAEVHVDGFRFDLASALCRDAERPSDSAFVRELLADPLLRELKLVAEPWDLGPGGYRLGEFPQPFREWNDRFRDDARRFARGDSGSRAALATRLAGSSDVFDRGGRPASSSINFVACHDGFTLWDVLSYTRKQNADNGEEDRDGRDDNFSQNLGVEGESDDPAVLELRARVARSLVLCLTAAQGVPMLGHGDERGRTQRGNNNAYNQDNALTWLDWQREPGVLAFARAAFAFRARHPALRCARFLHGAPVSPDGSPDLSWHHPAGHPMRTADWHDPTGHALGMLLRDGPASPLAEGVSAVLCVWNAGADTITFRLPALGASARWTAVLDSTRSEQRTRSVDGDAPEIAGRGALALEARR